MPLVKLEIKPGIVSNDTGLANEGGCSAGDRVRAYQGRIQPIGGWMMRSSALIEGVGRGSHAWSTHQGVKCLAIGTDKGLWGEYNGNLKDITGPLHETVLNNAFSTQSGSNVVTVSLPFHGVIAFQEVHFSNHQTTVGGLTIEGTYTVKEITSPGSFTIEAASNATSTVNLGGGLVDFKADLPPGLVSTKTAGYGTGPYGEGFYGSSGERPELRVWNLANWGEHLLANASGYGLWEWQPYANYSELAFNGNFTSSDGWGLGTGWSIAGMKAVKTAGTASNLSQSIEDLVKGGITVRVKFKVDRTAGSIKFGINAGATPAVIDVGYASSTISKSGTYTRTFRMPALAKDVVWAADAAFAGSISEVSYHIEDRAYRITTAPPVIDTFYVNVNGIVVAMGTTSVDEGAYDPTLVRTSDLGNNRAWVPDDGSYASFFNIRNVGGRIMQGLPTRQQDIVGGDGGIASLQFTGEVTDPFAVVSLGTGCGLISRHAMVEQNGFVFWRSDSNFYIFRGIGSTNLGVAEILPCPISKEIDDHIDQIQVMKCHAGIVAGFSEMWFFYPDTRDGDECSRAVSYSWTEGHWHTHKMDRTTWCSPGIFVEPIATAPNGRLYNHETGTTANGQNLGSWIETSDLDLGDGDKLLAILAFVPDFAEQVGSVALEFLAKFYPNDANYRSFGPYSLGPSVRRQNLRLQTRQVRLRFSTATTGGFWRMGASRIDLVGTAARR